MAQAFERGVVERPWEKLRGGLVLGGEKLWQQVCVLVGRKRGTEEVVWSKRKDHAQAEQQLQRALAMEADQQVRVWAQVRPSGRRQAELAKLYGYRDGSGVAYVVRRVEEKARTDRQLAAKLKQLKDEIYSLRS